jgi:hypothetical protein
MSEKRYEPEDVIVAILARLRDLNYMRFHADAVELHPAIYKLASKPNFKKFFGRFIFDTRDYFAYSRTLEEAIDSLQFAGYLERTNPRGTWYQITPSLKSVFDQEIAARFSPEEREVISTLAEQFVENVHAEKVVAAQQQ